MFFRGLYIRTKLSLFLLCGLITVLPSVARADCTSPAAPAGIIEYFSASEQVFKYCNGTDWVPWGDGGANEIWSDSGSGYIEYTSSLGGIKVGSILSLPAPDGATSSGSAPVAAGSDTQIQFNSGGSFGADPDLTWNFGTDTMNVVNVDYSGWLTDVSDRRMKENITPLESSLENLMTLQGYSFTMKDDASGQVEYGLMAQDVQPVFPELVKTHEDGMLSLNYVGLIAPMIETAKSQQSLIETQQAQIDMLKARLDALEARYGTGFDDPEQETGEQ